LGVGVDDAVVGDSVVDADEVTEDGGAGLGGVEERAEIGDVALDMPRGAEGVARLGGGSVVEIGAAEVNLGGAVVLASCGDGEVGGEDDFGPWSGSTGGVRVGEILGIEFGKLLIRKESYRSGLGIWAYDRRIGAHSIAAAEDGRIGCDDDLCCSGNCGCGAERSQSQGEEVPGLAFGCMGLHD